MRQRTSKNIKEIQNTANDYYGVILTQEQAEELIKNSDRLSSELLECDSTLDTQGREVFSSAMVKHVMKGMPKPLNQDKYESGWHWPLYGSTQEYKDEFDIKFKEAALLKGYKLSKGWYEKDASNQQDDGW